MRNYLSVLASAYAIAGILALACRPVEATDLAGAPHVDRMLLPAPGDTVTMIYHWTPATVTDGFGPITAIEAEARRAVPAPALTVPRAGLAPAKLRDTVRIPTGGLVDGQTTSGQLCVRSVRLGKTSAFRCTAWSTTFLIPAPPPPDTVIVDTLSVLAILVRPETQSVAAGTTAQWCAFARMSDGKIYGTTGTGAVPFCVAGYPTWFSVMERLPVFRETRVRVISRPALTATWRRADE